MYCTLRLNKNKRDYLLQNWLRLHSSLIPVICCCSNKKPIFKLWVAVKTWIIFKITLYRNYNHYFGWNLNKRLFKFEVSWTFRQPFESILNALLAYIIQSNVFFPFILLRLKSFFVVALFRKTLFALCLLYKNSFLNIEIKLGGMHL